MPTPQAFHVITKPIGPICNLDCTYCFYLEKESLYPTGEEWRMRPEVLETYIRAYIEAQDVPEVNFAWQGGEPTLLGIDFFRRAVTLQQRYSNGKRIHNALQTNGTLLDEQWCCFLRDNNFLVGLSIDGPRELHDLYRVDKKQHPTFDAVLRGIHLLKEHGVEFNTLTVVNRANSYNPLEVYRFLRDQGSGFIQFIPLVERIAPTTLKVRGLELAEPPMAGAMDGQSVAVTSWSVEARQYGEFLCAIFDEWVRNDVGKTFVQLFDIALGLWLGTPSALCFFRETCGDALALEHNGDLYACDHYVYPRYRLGNLMNESLGSMVASAAQRKFGEDKRATLPNYCRHCEVRFACNGECPKHRFMRTPDGEEGLNYLCAAYKRFFNHIDKPMKQMMALLRAGRPASDIMAPPSRRFRPDDPCPCGSGMRFGRCCG
jgi:uncharacterized protein